MFPTEISVISELKISKVLVQHQEIHPLVFFIFHVLLTPSINTLESSSDFMILLILFISSFEINKVNLFPALTFPFPFIFLSNLFKIDQAALVANSDKISLAKQTGRSKSLFSQNYLTLYLETN